LGSSQHRGQVSSQLDPELALIRYQDDRISKLGEFTPADVEACASRSASGVQEYSLVTARTRAIFRVRKDTPEEIRFRTTGLEDLAENTTSLYPQLRPQGWLEIAAADAARAAAAQASAAGAAQADATETE
jgi:hypothetical protein